MKNTILFLFKKRKNVHRNTVLVFFLICCLTIMQGLALAQVRSAEEIVNALKPKPLTRGLKVEDVPPSKIDLTINFEFNSAKLSSDAQMQLSELGKALVSQNLEELSFSVIGHTDGVGSDSYNMKLSKQRADSVVKYLNSRYSVNQSRV